MFVIGQKFDTDCYGCLNAKGCYYCPGDGICENSDEYSSSNKDRQCTTPNDYYSLSNGNIQDECISNTAYYKDPLWDANLWVYESINVEDVWSMYGYEGEGIVIRINDDGVDVTNKEFDGRFDIIENSCIEYLPLSNIQDDDGHGTAVAGIILANSNNNLCSAGIASKSKFSSCNFFANNVPYSSLAYKINTFDISQNSIGMP
jgi:subtilisin family serine protease